MYLSDFDQIHRGRRAFAIGNGPSLTRMDLSSLRDEITFAANRFYQHGHRFGLTPKYLCVTDPNVHRQIEADLPALPCVRFIPHISGYYCPQPTDEHCFALPYVWGPDRWVSEDNFRRRMDGVFHSGNTVIIDFIIQIAFCMGITELYLIGCDCTKSAGRHFFDAAPSDEPILRRDVIMNSYRACRTVYEGDDRVLANAGIGGELDVLPRVEFASLFEAVAV